MTRASPASFSQRVLFSRVARSVMMRGVYSTILAAGLLALAASPALAQPRPGFGPPAPTAAMLLNNDKVQAELKVSDDQKADIKKASDKIRDKYKDDIDKA